MLTSWTRTEGEKGILVNDLGRPLGADGLAGGEAARRDPHYQKCVSHFSLPLFESHSIYGKGA
jgi:hypothetical protein